VEIDEALQIMTLRCLAAEQTMADVLRDMGELRDKLKQCRVIQDSETRFLEQIAQSPGVGAPKFWFNLPGAVNRRLGELGATTEKLEEWRNVKEG
jgi:hypothetical protein